MPYRAKTYGIVYLETNPSMDSYLASFYADPMFYIGGAFVGAAVFAFLIFFRGFLTGSVQLITFSGNDEYLRLAYTRVIWGTYLLVIIFAGWRSCGFLPAGLGTGPRRPRWRGALSGWLSWCLCGSKPAPHSKEETGMETAHSTRRDYFTTEKRPSSPRLKYF